MARSDVQTGIAALQYGGVSGGGSPTSSFAIRRAAMTLANRALLGRRTQDFTCHNAETFFTAPDGKSATDVFYYDFACTMKRSVVYITITSLTATSANEQVTVTNYDRAGTVTSYDTLSISISVTNTTQSFTLVGAEYPNASSTLAIAQYGLTCGGDLNATSLACGVAALANAASLETGATLNISGTSSTSNGTTQANATVNASEFSAAPNALTLVPPSSGTAWGISGASPLATVSGTVSVATSGAGLANVSMNLSDGNGDTMSASNSGVSTIVTLTRSGQTLATATLDAAGNGTIAYADGTTEKIVGYAITG